MKRSRQTDPSLKFITLMRWVVQLHQFDFVICTNCPIINTNVTFWMNLFIMTQILRKIIYFFSFSHKTSRKCCWILHSTTLFLEFCTTQLHIWKFCSNCIILCVMHKGFNFCTLHWSTLFEMSNVIFFEENAFIMNLWKLHKINLSCEQYVRLMCKD